MRGGVFDIKVRLLARKFEFEETFSRICPGSRKNLSLLL